MASDSLLFYFITNVLRFENFSTRERGWGGADARSRGEKIERIHEATKTRYIQIHVTFVHLDIHWILFEASIARSLSFSRTHTNVLSLAPFFFFSFSFLNSREQSIRWPREKIRSNCHNIVIIRELFNKHRQMFFDVLYEFLFSFVSLLVYSVYTLVFC